MSDINKNLQFDWESLEIMLSGLSSLDANTFIGPIDSQENSEDFFKNYGFDLRDPVEKAELFGIYQESIQFIKRFFLKESDPEGLDLSIPNLFYSITNISDLLLISNGKGRDDLDKDDYKWAEIILKVMHTILHTDKDLRYHYFTTIQTQIFDRFYKFLTRDDENKLFLQSDDGDKIELVEFETKSKKTRESIIIKLLHKKENVAEELFDRIGVRLITKNKVDVLRVAQFLKDQNIIIPINIKPSRSLNTLFSIEKIKGISSEQDLEAEIEKNILDIDNDNNHSSKNYKAIHFTCRQLIKYQNPFLKEFNQIRKMAQKNKETSLSKKVLAIDTKLIAQSIRFFYPYEVQVTDLESHHSNTSGEASHADYKKSQLVSAMNRLFKPLLDK